MIWIDSQPRRHGPIARWVVMLAIPAALGVGCGGGGNGHRAATPTATRPPATATATVAPATPTPTGTSGAAAACAKLARCGQCFSDSTGNCITTDACAQRLSADVVLCINAGTACGADMLGDCLFPGCDGTDASGECQ